MNTLRIRELATSRTVTLPAWATLSEAYAVMRRLHIRHIPVLRDGEIVGMVSAHAIRDALNHRGAHPDRTTLDLIMDPPIVVAGDVGVDVVARRMADEKHAAVIVVDRDQIGMFTTIDALRALEALTRPDGRSTRPPPRRISIPG